MKIVYIGDFGGSADEGMRSISRRIPSNMKENHEVLRLNTGAALMPSNFRKVRQMRPALIHYLTGPTLRSLTILSIYRRLIPGCVTIASAVRPFFTPRQYRMIRWLKPDLILTQDPRWEAVFVEQGIPTTFLPNGVNLERFQPATDQQKAHLREQHGIASEKPVVLHVGHFRESRNLRVLAGVQNSGRFQVVVVGSTALSRDEGVMGELLKSGCIVINSYLPHIEELYALADYYVFPVKPPEGGRLPERYNEIGVIDMPLSVLEAMAANLITISTRLPALETVFAEGDGFYWFDGSAEDCMARFAMPPPKKVRCRDHVTALDWHRVCERLEIMYQSLIPR